MYDFIVLGIIPGTQIQITFELWLQLAASLCLVVIAWKMHRLHIFRNTVISLAFLFATTRQPREV